MGGWRKEESFSDYTVLYDKIQIYKFGWIQTSQTGGQVYSDISPYKVSECSLLQLSTFQRSWVDSSGADTLGRKVLRNLQAIARR